VGGRLEGSREGCRAIYTKEYQGGAERNKKNIYIDRYIYFIPPQVSMDPHLDILHTQLGFFLPFLIFFSLFISIRSLFQHLTSRDGARRKFLVEKEKKIYIYLFFSFTISRAEDFLVV
jgi:hypothetical protein